MMMHSCPNVSDSAQDDIIALGKAHMHSTPFLSSLSKVALKTVPVFVWLKHRSYPTSEGEMAAASFLHSSFLRAVNAVLLWPVHV